MGRYIANNKFERMWKGTPVAYFSLASLYFIGWTEEYREFPEDTGLWLDVRSWDLTDTKQAY
jgi:hypothetical protein